MVKHTLDTAIQKLYSPIEAFFIIGILLQFSLPTQVHAQTKNKTLTRQEWLADIDTLENWLTQKHVYPAWANPSAVTQIQSVLGTTRTLLNKENYHPNTIKVNLLKAIAAIRDGHTSITGITSSFGMIPLELEWLSDGIYITGTALNDTALLGGKITRIHHKKISECIDVLKQVVPHGNEWGFRNFFSPYLLSPGILRGIGIGNASTAITLEAVLPNGKHIQRTIHAVFSFQNRPIIQTLVTKTITIADEYRETNYYYKKIDQTILYLNIRLLDNQSGFPFDAFIRQADSVIRTDAIKKLIIDLRQNPGGNNFNNRLLIALIHKYPELNKRGQLFVLTGPTTYSAAVTLRADFETKTAALFAGLPVGDRVNHPGDAKTYTLPHSNIQIRISDYFWCYTSDKDKRIQSPIDIYHDASITERISGKDLLLEKVLQWKTSSNPSVSFHSNISGIYTIKNDIAEINTNNQGVFLKIKGRLYTIIQSKSGDSLYTTSPHVILYCSQKDTALILRYDKTEVLPMRRITSYPISWNDVITAPNHEPLRLYGNNLAYRAVILSEMEKDLSTTKKIIQYAIDQKRKPQLAERVMSRLK